MNLVHCYLIETVSLESIVYNSVVLIIIHALDTIPSESFRNSIVSVTVIR